MRHPLISAEVRNISPEINIFCIWGNTDKNSILIQFSYSFFLYNYWIFKYCLTATLMTSTKLVSRGLLKIKVFWNEDYDFIGSVNGVTKTFSRVSNCNVDVMSPKLGNYHFSERSYHHQKIWFFRGVALVYVP